VPATPHTPPAFAQSSFDSQATGASATRAQIAPTSQASPRPSLSLSV
jgi:hypothetical protein